METRYVTPTPICRECGKPQKTIKGIRPHKFQDRRTGQPSILPYLPLAPALAAILLATGNMDWIGWKGLATKLRAKNPNLDQWKETIDNFLEAGWITTRHRRLATGSYELHGIQVLLPTALEECAAPGVRLARQTQREEALRQLGSGPHSHLAREFLSGHAWETWPADAIPLLATVANHADSGKRLATRFVSGTKAEDTKLLELHQRRIESVLGSFEELGLRGHSSMDCLGGSGQLQFGGDKIDLATLRPYGGITVQQLRLTTEIRPGRGGICFIENKTVFESACFGELDTPSDATLIWISGQPSHGVQRLAQLAADLSCPITIWCDLDPSGIQIARLVHDLAGRGIALHMGVADYLQAPVKRPIQGKNLQLLQSLSTDGFLGELTAAMQEARHWVEHETQMMQAVRSAQP